MQATQYRPVGVACRTSARSFWMRNAAANKCTPMCCEPRRYVRPACRTQTLRKTLRWSGQPCTTGAHAGERSSEAPNVTALQGACALPCKGNGPRCLARVVGHSGAKAAHETDSHVLRVQVAPRSSKATAARNQPPRSPLTNVTNADRSPPHGGVPDSQDSLLESATKVHV
jgi:hypothetical protein